MIKHRWSNCSFRSNPFTNLGSCKAASSPAPCQPSPKSCGHPKLIRNQLAYRRPRWVFHDMRPRNRGDSHSHITSYYTRTPLRSCITDLLVERSQMPMTLTAGFSSLNGGSSDNLESEFPRSRRSGCQTSRRICIFRHLCHVESKK